MKIALCQFHIEWEKKEANWRRGEKFIKEAKEAGCDLIAFPEMSFTGFSMNTEKTMDRAKETEREIFKVAAFYDIAVGFGWTEKGEEKAQNHYGIVDKQGRLQSDYVKIHPFGYSGENLYFEGGKALSVFQLEGYSVSTFICYDLRFPEIFQAVSDSAELILVAANWPAARSQHWKTLLKARAIENQVYLAGVNCVGLENGTEYSGDSCIINPNGEMIEEIANKEGLIMAEIPKDTEKFREKFPVKRDRKVELYKAFFDK